MNILFATYVIANILSSENCQIGDQSLGRLKKMGYNMVIQRFPVSAPGINQSLHPMSHFFELFILFEKKNG